MKKRTARASAWITLFVAAWLATACNGGGGSNSADSTSSLSTDSSNVLNPTNEPALGYTGPVIPSGASPTPQENPSSTIPPVQQPAPDAPKRTYATDALLYAGTGSWSTEVSALKSLMDKKGMSYRAISSSELNAMTVDQLAEFGMIIWPGGYGGTAASSLTSATHSRLREAVQKRGVSYIGFCAGAFVAVAPAPAPGEDVSYGIGVVDGAVLDYYYLEYQGTTIAMTMASFPDGSKRDLLWYGGPVAPEVTGGVIARYPNGDAMISQMWSGSGFVVLSATHPAAPLSVGQSYGLTDSDGVDTEFAYQLIEAALQQKPMAAF